MNIENAVADHYGIPDLLGQIFTGLERVGADLSKLTTEDLYQRALIRTHEPIGAFRWT